MLTVTNLRKTFKTDMGQVNAVDGISFEIPPGKIFTLLGPSGCGKTTTLRMVAGLEEPDSGEIAIGERTVYSSEQRILVAANRREIGMVFQSYAIWPHMNVFENVAFPLRVKKVPKAEIRDRVHRALQTVQLDGLEKRPAPRLSGGQQQRLALARALVAEPKMLLLDEPLSNLDAKLREQMRFELKELQRSLGITTLYVTHDQIEALALSDTIAVMSQGRIMQLATPREIYENPNNQFVADFIGTTNFVPGTATRTPPDGGVETRYGLLSCTLPAGISVNSEVVISIRPEYIQLRHQQTEELNLLRGKVVAMAFLGEFIDCQIAVGDLIFRARLHPSTEVNWGQDIWVHLHPDNCTVIPLKQGQSTVA